MNSNVVNNVLGYKETFHVSSAGNAFSRGRSKRTRTGFKNVCFTLLFDIELFTHTTVSCAPMLKHFVHVNFSNRYATGLNTAL